MVRTEKQAREALEKLFPKPFTDYQWSLLSAQGYEEALMSGARTPNDVARELKELMEAASKPATPPLPPGADGRPESPLSWDQMEKLVLGRILTTGETSGPRAHVGSPRSGARVRRLAAGRERVRRRLGTLVVSGVSIAAVVVVVALVVWRPQCGSAGGAVTATTGTAATSIYTTGTYTSDTGTSTGATGTSLAGSPATIPALKVSDYRVELTGSSVVPAVKTTATGILNLTLSADGKTMDYVLTVQDLTGLTLVRLREGQAGSNGEVLVTLYPGPTVKGTSNGVVARWRFDAGAFTGPLKGKTMQDFIALVKSGSVYVLVGTTANKDGELRGQVQ